MELLSKSFHLTKFKFDAINGMKILLFLTKLGQSRLVFSVQQFVSRLHFIQNSSIFMEKIIIFKLHFPVI